MKTNKIFAAALAGLCAVSTMGVSAFAADEKVESAGTKSYKVNAAFAAPTIDVSVPEEVAAIINPYMIEVKISDTVKYEAEGVASPKYPITNNSTDVGINVKATYSAEGLDGVVATKAAAEAGTVAGSTDKKKLAYVTLNAESPLDVTKKDTTASAANAVNKLEFAADGAAEKEKTDVLMRLNVKADGKTDNVGKFWIGGAVTDEPTEKWSTSDKLSINVVLDINPFNTGATGGSGGGSTVTPGLKQDLVQTNFTGTGITAFAKGSANNEYTMTIDTTTNGGNPISLNLTSLVDNSQTITSKTAAGSNATVGGMGMNVSITPANTGSETVTITLSDSKTIVIKLTLT